jgi:hypothetical protein
MLWIHFYRCLGRWQFLACIQSALAQRLLRLLGSGLALLLLLLLLLLQGRLWIKCVT